MVAGPQGGQVSSYVYEMHKRAYGFIVEDSADLVDAYGQAFKDTEAKHSYLTVPMRLTAVGGAVANKPGATARHSRIGAWKNAE